MKVLKYFKLISLLLLVSSAVQEDRFEKLAKFACDVVEELVRDKPETKSISITLWQTWFNRRSFYNSIAQCMTPDIALISLDFFDKIVPNSDLSVDIIILVADEINWALFDTIVSDLNPQRILKHTAKFILLTKYSDPCRNWVDKNYPCSLTNYYRTLFEVTGRGVFNFVWAYLEGDEVNAVTYDFSTHSASTYKEKLNKSSLVEVLYPDKLKDLGGMPLYILSTLQTNRLEISLDRRVDTKFNEFSNILSHKMNINLEYDILNAQEYSKNAIKYFRLKYAEKRNQRSFILTFNTYLRYNDTPQKLLTYEDSSDCILVPLPKDETFGTELFLKPFDKFVWLALGLSFITSSVVWKIISKLSPEESSRNFSFGFYAYLLGQDVNIRNRELALKILLQIIIFMTIILSSSYQGVITSLIIGRTENRLKTFDELLKSDHILLTGGYGESRLKDNVNYQAAKNEGRVNLSGDSLESNYSDFFEKNFAVMIPCSLAEFTLQKNQSAAPFYYLLPERLFPSFVRLDAGFNNPYMGRIQQIMDECFAAGFLHAWKIVPNIEQKEIDQTNENRAITLNDIKPVFMILFIGNFLAFLTFIAEIIFRALQRWRNKRLKVYAIRDIRD